MPNDDRQSAPSSGTSPKGAPLGAAEGEGRPAMDPYSAGLAFAWHMQNALRNGSDSEATMRERLHALELAERFDLDQQIVEACGVLAAAETERFGAPVTERYVRLGLAAAARWGAHVGTFLMLEALYQMERGAFDVAERRFRDALEQCDPLERPRVLVGAGTLLLRGRRFDEACERFSQGLACPSPDRETRVRLLDGLAEGQRHAGDRSAAIVSSSGVLELTSGQSESNALARRYRARAFGALGLLAWWRGAQAEAERCFVASLDVWPEPEKLRVGEAFVAWERLVALNAGHAPPVEGSPGEVCALAWVRLGQDVLTPVDLTESPPSRETLARVVGWRPAALVEVALRSLLGHQAGERWHVSRVQTLRHERRVLVELLAAGPVE